MLIKTTIIAIGLLISLNLFAKDDLIYRQILDNNTNINREYAYKVSNIIYKYSRKYGVDPKLFTAILAQESMYNIQAKQCQSGLIIRDTKIETGEVCMDFGIAQINWKTAKLYDFDILKLINNLDYSIEAGIIVLKDIKKMYMDTEPDTYWTRYNSSNKQRRLEYFHLVKRWL